MGDEQLIRRWKLVDRVHRTVGPVALLGVLWWYLRSGADGLQAEAGAVTGLYAAGLLWAGYLAGPARWFGLRVDGWSFGSGAPVRTVPGPRGGWQLRRFPLPMVRPLLLGTDPASGPGRLLPALLAYLSVAALGGCLLDLAGGDFGPAAAVVCLAGTVAPALMLVVLHTTSAAVRLAPELQEVARTMQRDVAEARRLLDALPPSTAAGGIGLSVLLAEGRYRELADRAAESTARAGGAMDLLQARALAYLDETGAADDADRAAFHALYRAALRTPRSLRAGSDLPALYELARNHPGLAIDEARSAAAVGSTPLRRSAAYATLALAFHRAGRPEEARAALESARRTGPATARLDFLTGLLAAPEPAPAPELRT
ncbi:hypothetical protein OU787_17080 [Kitasatospora sp. YST-16]|uniref:hypothetical protein n=1 Tax=Kitasatospora sp. YST-16 TaxID=2998080 RepID=UPI002283E32F|nr:hypothetical protein [Kitasatospora sp. YST-16]WAL73069.1 hypothetical protein OU787_17080 [Kitasatospora sp. YST-16]WNW39121.1 hypothetical protein RKE32_17035 [Streptomyces sp. Li-HN-5-13]